ncbi:MAG: hypothetical protein ABW199_04905 [Caulobacterales bacterium]
MRSLIASVFLFALAQAASALEPADLVGAWNTQWANAPGEAVSGGGPMTISRDSSEDALDGVTPAPGMDGVMNGEVSKSADGKLVWSGRWASVWAEGATMGTFRFVFTNARSFTGVWSTDDGVINGAAWNGARAN